MNKFETKFSVTRMCHVLGVKHSSYYAWKKRPVSNREKENIVLLEEIKRIYRENKGRYGSPKIHKQLIALDKKCGHNRVVRLMRENGIRSIINKKYRHQGKAISDEKAAPNLLNREFNPTEPNKVWASDITYINTSSGWKYLCVIMDLYSRNIVGWSVMNNMRASLVVDALKKAYKSRKPPKGILIHSDRGSQYGSKTFRDYLNKEEMIQSMSRKGNCWDNACVESFFKYLKAEELKRIRIKNKQDLQYILFEYIEVFYNRKRIHSHLGYVSPIQYESEFEKKMAA